MNRSLCYCIMIFVLVKDDKNHLTGRPTHGINTVPQLFPDRCSAEVLGEVMAE